MTQESEINYNNERLLLKHLLSNSSRLKNNPELILEEIEAFGQERNMPCLSTFKAKKLIHQIHERLPEVIVQFGTHTGYTSLLAANEFTKISGASGSSKVFTFETDPVYHNISHQIIELSGLQNSIVQIFGKSGKSVQKLADSHEIEKIDLLVLDHWKDCYLANLRVVETLSLITVGSVIFADNNSPVGAPDYHCYVNGSPQFKRDHNLRLKNPNDSHYLGRWGLLYESQMITSAESGKEPTNSIEMTKCIGLLDG